MTNYNQYQCPTPNWPIRVIVVKWNMNYSSNKIVFDGGRDHMTYRRKNGAMLSISEVAQLLNVHVNTVRRWTNKGILKSYRLGPRNDRRFQQQDITSFLVEQSGMTDGLSDAIIQSEPSPSPSGPQTELDISYSKLASKIIVMIVDKLAFLRAGLHDALSGQTDFTLMDCDPGQDVSKAIETKIPDVILMDIDYPTLSGLELTRKIARSYPSTRIIILSSNPDVDQLFEVAKTGAVAYLDKNIPIDQLATTIRRAHMGEYPINDSLLATPKVAEHILRQFQSSRVVEKSLEGVIAQLTAREMQILNLIANGNSNKQIAEKLRVSDQTIKSHVSAILRKLNANDRAHAVALAVSNGWLPLKTEVVNQQDYSRGVGLTLR